MPNEIIEKLIVAGEKLWLYRDSNPGPFADLAKHSTTEQPSHPFISPTIFTSNLPCLHNRDTNKSIVLPGQVACSILHITFGSSAMIGDHLAIGIC